jgi:chromosome segregation ATPase
MGLLTVPRVDDPSQSRPFSPDEKLEHLRGLLKAAEDRFGAYKERFKKTDKLAKALYQKRKQLEGDLNEQGKRIASQTGRIEEALAQSLRVTRELEASARARGELEAMLAQSHEDVERLQTELTAEREARAVAEEALRIARNATPSPESEERCVALEAEVARLTDELGAVRAEAGHERQAAEVSVAGLEGELRRIEEELERVRPLVERGQALEGQVQILEQDRDALRASYERAAEALGAAEGQARQAFAEVERQQQAMALIPAPAALPVSEDPTGELQRLREELREERAARLESSKLEREQELRAAQALREAQDQRARMEAIETAIAEAERAFMEAAARAERLAGELEAARNELKQARADAKNAAELESGLRVSLARAEELQQANIVLTSEMGAAARAAGAAEARIGELSRELDRVAGDLELEQSLRREADERARGMGDDLRAAESRLAEALRRAEEAEERSERQAAFAAPPSKAVDPSQVTLVPELVDAPETDDLMMETLLRFIEPDQA